MSRYDVSVRGRDTQAVRRASRLLPRSSEHEARHGTARHGTARHGKPIRPSFGLHLGRLFSALGTLSQGLRSPYAEAGTDDDRGGDGSRAGQARDRGAGL